MEHDGYESDRNRLFILDCKTAEKYELPGNWDYSIDEFAWAPDSKSITFIAPKDGVIPVFQVAMKKGAAPVQLVDVQADFTSLQVTKDYIVTMMHSMLRPQRSHDNRPQSQRTRLGSERTHRHQRRNLRRSTCHT